MLEFFLAIIIMLASALLLGEVFHKVGQPALVGQLLAGILIGPSVFNFVQPTTDLTTVENVALFFIMLLTGLAVKPDRIIKAGKRGALVSSISFIIPFVAGVEIAQFFGIGLVSSLTIGLAISITAVPVNSIILMELGLLDSELGVTVIAAGVIDDIISFIALTIIQQFHESVSLVGYTSILIDIIKVLIFLGGFILCGHFVRANLPRISKRIDNFPLQMRTPGSHIAIIIICAVGISLLAEWSGLQLVIGAFFAGLLLSELVDVQKLVKADEVIRGMTFGFFGPLAFAFIGTEFVLNSLTGLVLVVVTLLPVAVASKLLGGYIGARLSKFSSLESVTIGFLMNSRGFVELVIAATAYQLGLIDQTLFSLVVGVGIVTTIISPIASRIALRKTKLQAVTSPASISSSEQL